MVLQVSDEVLGLPRQMGDGLILRRPRPEEAPAVAEFNAKIHSDTSEPSELVYNWTIDLMRGDHPTTNANDFLVVFDENKGNKVVSTLCTISQVWSYEEVPFKVGRPEIVGTDAEYRRKGLVRTQFEIIHALSAARGEMLQGITGIPWYYRQFGYEMGLSLRGGRRLYWPNVSQLGKDQPESLKLRPATLEDLPLLVQLYEKHCSTSMIRRVRSETEWRYDLTRTNPQTEVYRYFSIIENLAGEAIGYCEAVPGISGPTLILRELAVLPGNSLRTVCEFLSRALKARVEELNKERKEPLIGISFAFGLYHPAYEAMGGQLEKQLEPYAWYIRVPDLPGFIRHIAPVLERRLVGSVVEGYTGPLNLNFYRSTLSLTFDKGKLVETGGFVPDKVAGGDACFPDLTFLQLVFGYRSLEELRYSRVDCFASNDRSRALLNALFPKKPSELVDLV